MDTTPEHGLTGSYGQKHLPADVKKEVFDRLTSRLNADTELIVFLDEATHQYFIAVGGEFDSDTFISFADPDLRKRYSNPLAYTEINLKNSDLNYQQDLSESAKQRLKEIASAFSKGTVKEVACLKRSYPDEISVAGEFPVGLDIPINRSEITIMALKKLSEILAEKEEADRMSKWTRPKNIEFYGCGGDYFAKVSIETTYEESCYGIKHQFPVTKSMIYNLTEEQVAGKDATLRGRRVDGHELNLRDDHLLTNSVLSQLFSISHSDKGEFRFAFSEEDRERTLTMFAETIAPSEEKLTSQLTKLIDVLIKHPDYLQDFPEPIGKQNLATIAFTHLRMFIEDSESITEDTKSAYKDKSSLTITDIYELMIDVIKQDPKLKAAERTKLSEMFSGLLATFSIQVPGFFQDQYPQLNSQLEAQNFQTFSPITFSNEGIYAEVLEALKNEDLSNLLMKHRTYLKLEIKLNDQQQFNLEIRPSGRHESVAFHLEVNGQEKCFVNEQAENNVYTILLNEMSMLGQASFELNQMLGFDLEDVWKCALHPTYETRELVPSILMRNLGFQPVIANGNVSFDKTSDTDELQDFFNQMLLAGLKKMQEIGAVTVNPESMSDINQTSVPRENTGPMSKEDFDSVFPKGIVSNTLLLADKYKEVFGLDYPREFVEILFFLDKEYYFDVQGQSWEKKDF